MESADQNAQLPTLRKRKTTLTCASLAIPPALPAMDEGLQAVELAHQDLFTVQCS